MTAAQLPDTAAPGEPPCSAARVLVVDDQPANRLLMAQQLEFLGLHPSTCANGVEGLQTWRQYRPPVVILDCNMPLMNGYQLARAIREHEQLSSHPPCTLLGYTANVRANELEQCLAAGMDDCLFKPVGLEALRRRLAHLLPAAPTMQLQALYPLTGGDITLTRRLLEQVLSSCEADQALLMLETRRQAVIDLAHRIKGAARIVRAGDVCRACEAIERAEQRNPLGALQATLWEALGELQQHLRKTLKTL